MNSPNEVGFFQATTGDEHARSSVVLTERVGVSIWRMKERDPAGLAAVRKLVTVDPLDVAIGVEMGSVRFVRFPECSGFRESGSVPAYAQRLGRGYFENPDIDKIGG